LVKLLDLSGRSSVCSANSISSATKCNLEPLGNCNARDQQAFGFERTGGLFSLLVRMPEKRRIINALLDRLYSER
jgi:hypothetical protein